MGACVASGGGGSSAGTCNGTEATVGACVASGGGELLQVSAKELRPLGMVVWPQDWVELARVQLDQEPNGQFVRF